MSIKEYKNKTVLKGMNLAQITKWCESINQSSFRAKQIYQWMYKHGVSDSKSMNNISKELRDIIDQKCIIDTLSIEKIDQSSIEKTQKNVANACQAKAISASISISNYEVRCSMFDDRCSTMFDDFQ